MEGMPPYGTAGVPIVPIGREPPRHIGRDSPRPRATVVSPRMPCPVVHPGTVMILKMKVYSFLSTTRVMKIDLFPSTATMMMTWSLHMMVLLQRPPSQCLPLNGGDMLVSRNPGHFFLQMS